MQFNKIKYKELNSRQKEIYNFQKLSSVLADYGFNCIKLADDWLGADFLAYHKDGKDTLRVQLKSRLTIDKKYIGSDLYMVFPIGENWCLIDHDLLIEIANINTNWLLTDSWINKGLYHSANPNKTLLKAINKYILK